MQGVTLLFELEASVLFCVRKLRFIAFVIWIGLHALNALLMKVLIFFSAQMWTLLCAVHHGRGVAAHG
jgi:hypothetical protein